LRGPPAVGEERCRPTSREQQNHDDCDYAGEASPSAGQR
jgi:hypothetical protein